MARTVNQLSAVPNEADQTVTLFAVASDGTLWYKLKATKAVLHQPDQSEGAWTQLSNIPQMTQSQSQPQNTNPEELLRPDNIAERLSALEHKFLILETAHAALVDMVQQELRAILHESAKQDLFGAKEGPKDQEIRPTGIDPQP